MVWGRKNFQKAWRNAGREFGEGGEEDGEGRGGRAPSAAARRGRSGTRVVVVVVVVVVGDRCWGSYFRLIGKRKSRKRRRTSEHVSERGGSWCWCWCWWWW